jgi:hypothetical protein
VNVQLRLGHGAQELGQIGRGNGVDFEHGVPLSGSVGFMLTKKKTTRGWSLALRSEMNF